MKLIKHNGIEREGDPNYNEWRKLVRSGERDDRYALVFTDEAGVTRIFQRCGIQASLLNSTLRALRQQNPGVEFRIEDALEGFPDPSAGKRV